MKRSEMIKDIYNKMCDNPYGQYGEFMLMAGSILDLIEEAGMQPPPLYISESGNMNMYEWESEDE